MLSSQALIACTARSLIVASSGDIHTPPHARTWRGLDPLHRVASSGGTPIHTPTYRPPPSPPGVALAPRVGSRHQEVQLGSIVPVHIEGRACNGESVLAAQARVLSG